MNGPRKVVHVDFSQWEYTRSAVQSVVSDLEWEDQRLELYVQRAQPVAKTASETSIDVVKDQVSDHEEQTLVLQATSQRLDPQINDSSCMI
ncbi:uncharacterized protein N7496_010570 [Penicillium cataractarum]|uniref:Uncharacterized protein n=1 Tax=Penicillium cataractarum TaxID=2100454 RepID=A0A9W9V105_9EURO|nr:uncharacterized protein N7496_010570 [Penicillium cataractarum]KAJ5364857.1 hypothetical protein N7496_010570 [Penicillium cataractarum]